jgi:hypothetical protein
VGGRVVSAEWNATDLVMADNRDGYKASFYVTNFPENMPLYRLRQAFEVCGILSDLYVARHRNSRGQEFGFVRFVNVKNKGKLLQALNGVWVGDCRVLTREARFDRFAHNGIAVGKKRPVELKVAGEKDAVMHRKDDTAAAVQKGKPVVVSRVDEQNVTVGSVVVSVRELERKKRKKTVKLGSEGVVGFLWEERKGGKAGGKEQPVAGGGKGIGRVEELNLDGLLHSAAATTQQQPARFIPAYTSCKEDREWATSGMVAQIKAGDSALSFQQRIEDAGFPNVSVTPLGGDRVLLNCTGGEVFSNVLKGALDFFGMLFCNFQNWSDSLVRYERGAWLRVYGIPVHT